MKNYARYFYISKKLEKSFIINYEIINNQIKINLANGKHPYIPYSKENENYILNQMRSQVIKAQKVNEKIENIPDNDLEPMPRITKIILLSSTILVIGGAVTLNFLFSPLISLIIGGSILGSYFTFFSLLIKHEGKIKKDFEKNQLFIDNEEKINQEINENILSNTSQTTQKIVYDSLNQETGKPEITLNTIHKIKYEQLKQILANIELDNSKQKVIDLNTHVKK